MRLLISTLLLLNSLGIFGQELETEKEQEDLPTKHLTYKSLEQAFINPPDVLVN